MSWIANPTSTVTATHWRFYQHFALLGITSMQKRPNVTDYCARVSVMCSHVLNEAYSSTSRIHNSSTVAPSQHRLFWSPGFIDVMPERCFETMNVRIFVGLVVDLRMKIPRGTMSVIGVDQSLPLWSEVVERNVLIRFWKDVTIKKRHRPHFPASFFPINQ